MRPSTVAGRAFAPAGARLSRSGRMATWQARLEKLVRLGDRLPGDLGEVFSAARPEKSPWPSGLPSCPALEEFYRLCDGGSFSDGQWLYDFLPRHHLAAEAISLAESLGPGGEDEIVPERYLVLAQTDWGDLVWVSVRLTAWKSARRAAIGPASADGV